MASAQLLEITNAINSEVMEIADNVIVVDDRVAGVDDRVAGVDDRVKDVNCNVRAVDDKLAAVIDGAQYTFNTLLKTVQTSNASRWERSQGSYQASS